MMQPILFKKCFQCKQDPFNRVCKSRYCMENKPIMTTIRTSRREHKSHVPSACVNCKIAHLACDLSRPCKRCITLNKVDTCQDTLQKKRGRPKSDDPNNNNYEILFGTIQTPTISSPTRPITKPKSNSFSTSCFISFIHEPMAKPRSKSLDTTAYNQNTIQLILSMDAYCARVSDEDCWGYKPYQLQHRSFYDFISPQDTNRFATLYRLLLENSPEQYTHTEKTPSLLFSNTDINTLYQRANGANTFSDTLHIKKHTGDYELYDVFMYIGGGLGADLSTVTHLSKQYVVAQFRKHVPAAASATFVNTIFTKGEQTTTIIPPVLSPPTSPPSPIRLHPPVKQSKPQQHNEMSIRSLLC